MYLTLYLEIFKIFFYSGEFNFALRVTRLLLRRQRVGISMPAEFELPQVRVGVEKRVRLVAKTATHHVVRRHILHSHPHENRPYVREARPRPSHND